MTNNETNTYARSYRGRINHLIAGDGTRCGLSLVGMAKWPASLMPRVDCRPTCAACRCTITPPAPSCRCYGKPAHPVHPWWVTP